MNEKKKRPMKKQNALLRVQWNGLDIVDVYKPIDNLGVAGLRIGPFYVDYNPETLMLYGSWRGPLLPFFRWRLWPRSQELRIEGEVHMLHIGLRFKPRFR